MTPAQTGKPMLIHQLLLDRLFTIEPFWVFTEVLWMTLDCSGTAAVLGAAEKPGDTTSARNQLHKSARYSAIPALSA